MLGFRNRFWDDHRRASWASLGSLEKHMCTRRMETCSAMNASTTRRVIQMCMNEDSCSIPRTTGEAPMDMVLEQEEKGKNPNPKGISRNLMNG